MLRKIWVSLFGDRTFAMQYQEKMFIEARESHERYLREVYENLIKNTREAYEAQIADLRSERDKYRDDLFRIVHITKEPQPAKEVEKRPNLKSWPATRQALEAHDALRAADARAKYWEDKAKEFSKEIEGQKIINNAGLAENAG